MRILIIANKVPYPPKDGGSIATLTLAKHFSYLGHQVEVLAMNTAKHYFNLDQIPTELSDHIKFIGVDTEASISAAGALKNLLFSEKSYIAERFYTQEFRDKLKELFAKSDYDIIQLEGSYIGMYTSDIQKYSNAKIIMRAHNLEYEIWERTAKNSRLLKKYYFSNLAQRIKKFEVSQLNSFHAMIPITQRDANSLIGLGCRIPIHITPTGIDVEEAQRLESKIEFPSIFHIGALDWPPNQEGLLWFFDKVWPLVLKKHPQLNFYLAGRNAPSRIKNLEVTNLVYLGEVESAKGFMNSKAIGVVPLLSGSGMRIKIVEGMSLGKTMITTTLGVEGIAAKDGKDIMISDDPEEFAKKICLLVEDKELFNHIGENAFKFVRNSFDNKVIAKSLLDFYKSL